MRYALDLGWSAHIPTGSLSCLKRRASVSSRAAAAEQLLGEVGVFDDEDGEAGPRDLEIERDLEIASFHFQKPKGLDQKGKCEATIRSNEVAKQSFEELSVEQKCAIFAVGGLDYLAIDEAKRRRILSWTPTTATKYCVYNGPCYQCNPNLSINPSGQKRMPRIHILETCEKEQGERIYYERHGAKASRKRRRDGEG